MNLEKRKRMYLYHNIIVLLTYSLSIYNILKHFVTKIINYIIISNNYIKKLIFILFLFIYAVINLKYQHFKFIIIFHDYIVI